MEMRIKISACDMDRIRSTEWEESEERYKNAPINSYERGKYGNGKEFQEGLVAEIALRDTLLEMGWFDSVEHGGIESKKRDQINTKWDVRATKRFNGVMFVFNIDAKQGSIALYEKCSKVTKFASNYRESPGVVELPIYAAFSGLVLDSGETVFHGWAHASALSQEKNRRPFYDGRRASNGAILHCYSLDWCDPSIQHVNNLRDVPSLFLDSITNKESNDGI